MKTAIYIYIVFYLLYSTWTIAEDIKDEHPVWETVSDIVLLSLGFVGMILYQAEIADSIIKSFWKVVSVLLIIGQGVVNIYSRHSTLKGKGDLDPNEIPEWAILATDMILILILVPSLVFNILFAYHR